MSDHGDAFEASEMHDGARVVHRDKRISRGMAALLAVPGLLTIVLGAYIGFANSSAPKPAPSDVLAIILGLVFAVGLLLIAMGVVFGVLRTVVTERAVHVRYGLWGPTIPLDSIRTCKVVDYDWTEFGGWGIRLGKNGAWAYVPSSGPVVEVVYTDGGTEKRVLIGAANADAMAREIDRARGAKVRVGDEAAGGVRVDAAAETGGETSAEAETDDERERRAL